MIPWNLLLLPHVEYILIPFQQINPRDSPTNQGSSILSTSNPPIY